ncbi:hypothetical protein Tco_1375175 [Tanacetum coccineum]
MHRTTMFIWKWSQIMIKKLRPKRKERRNLQVPSKPTPAPKPKVAKEKPSKASTAKPPKPKPAKEKSTKATPLQKAGKGEGEEFDMERAIQMSLESFQAQGYARVGGVAIQEPVAEVIRPLPVVECKGKAIVTEEQAAQSLLALHTPKKASTGPSTQPQDDTSTNIVRDSPSPADAETGAGSDKTNSGGNTEILQINEELGEDVEKQVDLEEKTVELDQDQAGSNPESLKFLADEHVILEDPLSSTGTLSSMKNLEDAYAIGDQFINDKSTDDEPGKLNVEAEVVSMVTVPIYQASSSVPPLLTPVIDLSPPKPASSTTQAPIFTATTTTTPTTLPPPPQQQSITESELAERVAALEKKLSDLEQNNKNLDNTTQNLGSRVYTLELRDLPHKINEAVRENVKEAVQIALQAPLRDRFRDLSEEDMKEMVHQRMDEFLAEKDKSRKRRRDDQDPPPPPPPDSDQSDQVWIDINKPLPLNGTPGHVTIQTQFFFNKDLDYLRYGSKGSRQDLSVSKMKAARYHEFRLQLLIPEHMWIDDVYTYDISASYGISYWYDYLKEITLRRADHQEYTIVEKDFKNLYPSDFEDMNLLLLQGHLNHLLGLDIRMLSTAVKLWT